MSWIPIFVLKFLEVPLERIDPPSLSRMAFRLNSAEEIVVVRPVNPAFDHQFIFRYTCVYQYSSSFSEIDDPLPETYTLHYRLARTEEEIHRFIWFLQSKMMVVSPPPFSFSATSTASFLSQKQEFEHLLFPRKQDRANLRRLVSLVEISSSSSFSHSREREGEEGWKREVEYETDIEDLRARLSLSLYCPLQIKKAILLRGCTDLRIFRCLSEKNDLIYLLGEDHNDPGNFMECLSSILRETKCPIDILLESTYDRAEANSALGPFFSHDHFFDDDDDADGPISDKDKRRSNCREVAREFAQWIVRGKVPRQTQTAIRQNTPYFQKCIAPFQGRLKVWATDDRFADRFIFLQFLEIDLESPAAYRQNRDRLVHLFYDRFCDAARFLADFRDYVDRLETVLREIEVFVRCHFPGIRFQIRRCVPEKGGVRRLLQSMNRFLAPDAVREWLLEISRQSWLEKLYFSCLFDLPTTIRVLRLLRQNEDRLVFVLCGTYHVQNIAALLRNKYRQRHSNDDKDGDGGKEGGGGFWIVPVHDDSIANSPSGMALPFPLLLRSSERTSRMRVYQELTNKR